MTALAPSTGRAARPARHPYRFEDGPRFRPEIQALRTLAVLAVVLFHLSPTHVPGGYVGVDVFFVISGFLITSHLLRDSAQRGRPPLATFWLRRVRRLLPAALLVLAATLIAVLLVVPAQLWRQFLNEILGSTLYVENWVLAFSSVDYFAEDQGASPVQHYWSLSTEEQFYLVWPLLIAGLLLVATRHVSEARQRVVMAGGIAAVLAASLAYSAAVATEPYGYFSTFTHAWEFGAGALLALWAAPLARVFARMTAASAVLAWAGYAAIVAAIFLYDGSTPFPGVAALLPVFGTLAVIAAGSSDGRGGPDPIAGARPVQWVGDVSYSLYLWHWPPIVIVPFVTGHGLTHLEKAAILVGSFVLAWATKRWVEDRFRSGALDRRGRIRTVVALIVAMGVMSAGCLVPVAVLDGREATARSELSRLLADPCFGAGDMLDPDCSPDHTVIPLLGPAFAARDTPNNWRGVEYQDCAPIVEGVPQCVFGPEDADTVIAVIGDSHVEHLLPAIAEVSEERGWQIKLMWRAGCRASAPASPALVDAFDEELRIEGAPHCVRWKDRVGDVVAADAAVDLVLTTSGSRPMARAVDGDEAALRGLADDFSEMWSRLASTGRPVVVIRDMPLAPQPVPDCIAASEATEDPCALPRAEALVRDPIDVAISAGLPEGVEVLDLTNGLCDARVCHFVVGGAITHYDSGHLSATFARTLAPALGAGIDATLQESR